MKKTVTLVALMCIIIITAFAPFSAIASDNDVKTITILPYERQTIKGWGCFAANYYGGVLNKTKSSNHDTQLMTRKAAMSTLLNDMGVTILRAEILSECGNGDASLNEDWMTKVAESIKLGLDAGIKDYLITSWGPPYEMMTGSSGAWRFNPDYEDLYCKFIINAFDFLVDYGCTPPTAYSFQNEPQTGRNWPRITMEQYARIIKKMRKALDEAGYEDVLLMAPECAAYYQHSVQMGNNYSALYEDPEFEKAIGIFGTHSYAFLKTGESKNTDVYKFAMNVGNFTDRERWQTEFSGGRIEELDDISMNLGQAIYTTRIMLGDVIWGGMTRWMYWNGYENRQYLYADKTAKFMDRIELGSHQALLYGNGFDFVKKNNIGVALSTIWKNVPIGSVVHWSWTDDDTLLNEMGLRGDLGAFQRPDGTTVLVVMNVTDTHKTYNLNNLGGVSAKIHTLDKDTDQVARVSYRNVTAGSIKNFQCEPYTINIIVTENEDLSSANITILSDETTIYADGVYTVPKADVTVKGYVDEIVDNFAVNGRDIEVNDDLSFSFDIDAKTDKKLVFRCTDPASGKTTEQIVDVVLKEGFVKFDLSDVPASVNTNSYTFEMTTGMPSDIIINGNKVSDSKDTSFKIPVELDEGINKFEISAVADTDRIDKTIEIFCDSKKPEIKLNDYEKLVNDWEFFVSGKVNEKLSSFKVGGNSVLVNDDLTFSAKAVLNEGNNEVVIEATDLYGNVLEEAIGVTYTKDENTPHYVNGKTYVRKADESIIIDGKFTEESWKIDHKISKQVNGLYSSNNICNFGLLWDENYLYIGAKVKDSQYHGDTQYAYNNDSIEFLFNPSASRAGSFEPADKQLFSGPINGNKNSYFQNKKAPGIKQAYTIHEDGYEAEIAVPWTEIEKLPEIGAILAFEIVCNDDDTDDTSRTSIMTWSSEHTDYYSITSDYGLIELVESDDFRYEDIPFKASEKEASGETSIVINGVTYSELNHVCDNYGSIYYDNPNTGLVNIFTSHTRKIDITEGAYQTFVDGELVTWKNPIIKQDAFYYIDAECEKVLFAGIEAFERYPN